MKATLAVLGSGSLAKAVCYSLAAVLTRPTTVVVAARSDRVTAICQVAEVRAALSGRPVMFRPAVAELADPDTVTELLADARPDALLLCASTQSPWERLAAPSGWTDLVDRAGFGVTLPLHAELALAVGRSMRRACPDAWYLNACLPDAVNAVLVALDVPVLAGIGNVALLAAGLQAALGLPDQGRLAVLGHHVHLQPPDRREDECRVWSDGVPVTAVGKALAALRAVSRPELNQITGHAAALLLAALRAGDGLSAHLPGPHGRPGGYPVHISWSGVTLRLPAGMTETEAIEANQRWAALDGVVVEDGRVTFARAAAELLDPVVPGTFTVDRISEVAQRLHVLRERLRGTPTQVTTGDANDVELHRQPSA